MRVMAGKQDLFAGLVPRTKRRLLLRAWKKSIAAMANLFALTSNMTLRITHPPGLWVAFLGQDGSGKTTVGEVYLVRLATLFYSARQRQPRWLPALGRLVWWGSEPIVVPDLHRKPPHGLAISVLRFGNSGWISSWDTESRFAPCWRK